MDTTLVAKLGAISNLTHGFIYFSDSATDAYSQIGLGPSQRYFASRGAALGPASAELIIATFFNFNPEIVYRAIPAAWDVASPQQIQAVRMQSAGAQLAALAALNVDELDEATELAGAMAQRVAYEGRPLAGANRSVPEPDDPWSRLWQRLTVIREWRGDAHVAVLSAAPVTAVEALVLHAATGQVPKKALVMTRQWSEDAWQAAVDKLQTRGLLEADGSFTSEGRAFRDEIEHRTNIASLPLVDSLGDDATRRLIDLLKPVRQALVDSGAFARLQGVSDTA